MFGEFKGAPGKANPENSKAGPKNIGADVSNAGKSTDPKISHDARRPKIVDNRNEKPQRRTCCKKSVSNGLIFAVIICTMGSGFQHGYNTGVMNAPQNLIENWVEKVSGNDTSNLLWGEHHVTFVWSVIVSMFCTGGLFGACLTRLLADSLGRKFALWLNNVLIVPGAFVEGFAKTSGSYKMLILGRFFIGINAGLNSGLATLYVSEIAPTNIRGAVGVSYQLSITIGILISSILGLESLLGSEHLWPYLFGCVLLPAFFQFITLPFCPESPRFLLVEKGKEQSAERELTRLRCQREEVESELDELRKEREKYLSYSKVGLHGLLTTPELRMPLLISIVLNIGQQFSGIDAVLYFSTNILQFSSISNTYAQFGTIGMAATVVAITIISFFLVDTAGRKTLLLLGFGGMIFVTIFLTTCLHYAEENVKASYACFAFIILFVAFFAVGVGNVPWIIPPEIFDQSARSLGVTISVAANWVANFIVGLGFLPLHEIMNAHIFIIFLVLLSFFFVFTWKKVPETKKKTIEEIAAMFKQRSYS